QPSRRCRTSAPGATTNVRNHRERLASTTLPPRLTKTRRQAGRPARRATTLDAIRFLLSPLGLTADSGYFSLLQYRALLEEHALWSLELLALRHDPPLQCPSFDVVNFAVRDDFKHGGECRSRQAAVGVLHKVAHVAVRGVERARRLQIKAMSPAFGIN